MVGGEGFWDFYCGDSAGEFAAATHYFSCVQAVLGEGIRLVGVTLLHCKVFQ